MLIFSLDDAEQILDKEQFFVAMPKGPLTFQEVENFRLSNRK